MVKVIQDIWIQQNNGIVLFSRVYNRKIEDQLFGALMSALSSFTQELDKEGLSSFELSDKRFIVLKKRTLLFIANSSKKFKHKKVLQELEEVSEKFFKTYQEKLENWDDDVSIFADFEKEIESALEDPVKKFWDDF